MRGAPAFELTLGLSASERLLMASLAGAAAAALAAWWFSLIDASAARPGYGAWLWLAAVAPAAAVGGWAGWSVAMSRVRALRWSADQWICVDALTQEERQVIVEPRLDLGSWLLLVLRSPDGVTRWVTAGRTRAGAAWHPLRATLFGPTRRTFEPDPGEGAPR